VQRVRLKRVIAIQHGAPSPVPIWRVVDVRGAAAAVAALALAPCIATGERAPSIPVPSGIVCHGVSDDTASLQSAPDRGGLVALRRGRKVASAHSPSPHRDARAFRFDAQGARCIPTGVVHPPDGRPRHHTEWRHRRQLGRDARDWLLAWCAPGGRRERVTLQNRDSGQSVSSAARAVASRTTARRFRGHRGGPLLDRAGTLITDRCPAEGNRYAGFLIAQLSTDTVINGLAATSRTSRVDDERPLDVLAISASRVSYA
jgi:hypothetical protein